MAGAGSDGLTVNPPNLILAIIELKKTENSHVVVVISHPVVDGSDLV